MNKAITEGLDLMPTAFSDGLDQWSATDGTPGSPTLDVAANAVLVASDPDFGTCLELQKNAAVESIRYMGEVPYAPGCYLRISARVKVMSGAFPSVRVAGWAGQVGSIHVTGLNEVAPELTLSAYGQVYEVSAYVGSGARTGVDMVWGMAPDYGHFGLDFIGLTGGVVRVESVRIEDMTSTFYRKMMDWVDVRDFGAVGDGVADDAQAFRDADAAAAGAEVLVPAGSYFIGSDVTMNAPVRFEGTVSMAAATRLSLNGNFDYDAYLDAFGDERVALERALQALFHFSDHESLDLCGRRIQLTAPIDVHAAVGDVNTFANRRVLRNGQLQADVSTGWDTSVVTGTASYDPASSTTLSGVSNVANIEVGALVTGQGVGREVYVRAKDDVAGTVTLSLPLFNPPSSQTYTFTRFRYLLDFSGFTSIKRFNLEDVELLGKGNASGLLLASDGLAWSIRDCYFTSPKDRAITSHGGGCNGLTVEGCQFLSNEQALLAQNRVSVALNANSNDLKIRGNRVVRFRHFAVLNGGGHMISANHFFQGDSAAQGQRTAGIVLSQKNAKTVLTGNYVDNCWIELSGEHDPFPAAGPADRPFGALSVIGNIFTADDVPAWFTFLRLVPHGSGHVLDGLTVTGNTFKCFGGAVIDRVDEVDTTFADFDHAGTRDMEFHSNSYVDVLTRTESPALIEASVATPLVSWPVPTAGRLPFGGRALGAEGLTAIGQISGADTNPRFAFPGVNVLQGQGGDEVSILWAEPVSGKVQLRVRSDLV